MLARGESLSHRLTFFRLIATKYHRKVPTIRQDGPISEFLCEDALDFVSVLNPLNGVFVNTPQLPTFIFRGVSSVAFPLLPAAYRKTCDLLLNGSWVSGPRATVGEQCHAELATIRHF